LQYSRYSKRRYRARNIIADCGDFCRPSVLSVYLALAIVPDTPERMIIMSRPKRPEKKDQDPTVPVSPEVHTQMKLYRATHPEMTLNQIASEAIMEWLDKKALI